MWTTCGVVADSVALNTLLSRSVASEVDECHFRPYICGQGVCYNTAEGYTCHCHEGYRLDDTHSTCVGEESRGQRSSCVFGSRLDRIVCEVQLGRLLCSVRESLKNCGGFVFVFQM